jgi:hypothetical protein
MRVVAGGKAMEIRGSAAGARAYGTSISAGTDRATVNRGRHRAMAIWPRRVLRMTLLPGGPRGRLLPLSTLLVLGRLVLGHHSGEWHGCHHRDTK